MLSNQPLTSDHPTTRPAVGLTPWIASSADSLHAAAIEVNVTLGRRPPHPGVRRATRDEQFRALQIALGCDSLADDETVIGFMRYALANQIDLGEIRVPRHDGPLQAAIMPVAAKGRSCLVLCPSRLGKSVTPQAWREAISEIAQFQRACGTRVMQVLLAQWPSADPVAGVFAAEGFGELATLCYLHRPAAPPMLQTTLPAGMRLLQFTEAVRPLFERAVAASYIQSLDCPALHKVRPMDEVMEGHAGAGEFRPEWWHVLVREGRTGELAPVGVLLLAGIGEDAAAGLELVYLGMAPAMRGRGLARHLVGVALEAASRTRGGSLTLAVDDRNAPALALYESSGFELLQRRRVLGRDLVRQCALGETTRAAATA